MNILLLGSGGREHALAWKMAQSPACKNLYIAPGNGGTRECGINVGISVTDFASIRQFVLEKAVDLVVVGPEDPLVKGISDFFKADAQLRRIPVIGPGTLGARIEGSKDFSKGFMQRHGIPTAAYATFTKDTIGEAYRFMESLQPPYVLKADGLAAGKGVLILDDYKEACAELEVMLGGKFGAASEKVVIEQFLKGIELSVFIVTDGKEYCILPEAKDYKRIGEGDTGPNTGGMGSLSAVPFATPDFIRRVEQKIILPTVNGLSAEGIPYLGFIFFGLINVGGEPFVIEYNARMGDPETESVMPRLKNDILEVFDAALAGGLQAIRVEKDPRSAAAVMMVSGGYPGGYEKNKKIDGLKGVTDSIVFHAGTRYDEARDAHYTDGGRVLAVVARGDRLEDALKQAYADAEKIRFEGAYYRKDLGFDLI